MDKLFSQASVKGEPSIFPFSNGGKRMKHLLVEVKKLVADQCANHAGKKNYCWRMERSNRGTCVYFNPESDMMPRCSYFEVVVLPLDSDLQESYEDQLKGGENGRQADSGERSYESPELKELGLG